MASKKPVNTRRVFQLGKREGVSFEEGRKGFAWSIAEQEAFNLQLSKHKVEVLRKYFPKLSRKTLAFADSILPEIVRKFKAGEIDAEKAVEGLLVSVDSFILSNLPVLKTQKEKSLKIAKHEARLSVHLMDQMAGRKTRSQEIIELLRKGLNDFETLSPKLKKQFPFKDSISKLRQKLRFYSSEAKPGVLEQHTVVVLKTINAGAMRNVIGDEMADLYVAAYRSIKPRIVAAVLQK